MNKLKLILPQNILSNINKSLIMPHINYCILLCGHANKRIFNLHKINYIYRLQLLKLYFKCKQNLLPVYFDSFDLIPNYRVHQHNTQNIKQIHEPYDFAKTCSRYGLHILVIKASPSNITIHHTKSRPKHSQL